MTIRLWKTLTVLRGYFFASGQLQIIFGTGTVNKVYDAFIEIAGITESTKRM